MVIGTAITGNDSVVKYANSSAKASVPPSRSTNQRASPKLAAAEKKKRKPMCAVACALRRLLQLVFRDEGGAEAQCPSCDRAGCRFRVLRARAHQRHDPKTCRQSRFLKRQPRPSSSNNPMPAVRRMPTSASQANGLGRSDRRALGWSARQEKTERQPAPTSDRACLRWSGSSERLSGRSRSSRFRSTTRCRWVATGHFVFRVGVACGGTLVFEDGSPSRNLVAAGKHAYFDCGR